MKRFVEGVDRSQSVLFPERLDEYIDENNPVRVVDVFVDELDRGSLGFDGVTPAVTGRPGYHPATLLKIYIYGYLNRVPSSRRLEREAQRNLELIWLAVQAREAMGQDALTALADRGYKGDHPVACFSEPCRPW